MLDSWEGSVFVAGRLERVNSPIAAEAAAALRRGERNRAAGILWRALIQL